MKNKITLLVLLIFVLQSCVSKKEVLYLQDANKYNFQDIDYVASTIQPDDILSITVKALIQETTIPYNVPTSTNGSVASLDIIKLQGYLVSKEGSIVFPVLGSIDVVNKSTSELEKHIQNLLEEGGHLRAPVVSVRLLNAKVTVLGEVNKPGTYSFTEQNITLPQALGYAGDLTIYGEREDVLLITDENGIRKIVHINLTKADWFNSPQYYIKPNDVIVVNPNDAKVRSAGIIGDAGTVLTIVSVILSSVILITNL